MKRPRRLGRYEIVETIGSGGMGEVFLGRAMLTDGIEKRVAIKRVHPAFAADPELAEMFLQEARLSTLLEHPNIVHVSEVGREDGALFIVMSYLEGASLAKVSRRIRKHGQQWPLGAVLEVGIGILSGLAYAHTRRDYHGEELSIVHRDVSPQNVFITSEGVVKLLDFGIAKAANDRVVTLVGQRKGKAGYMSPEQEFGRPLDGRSDVYSAGIVLHELLTGARPYPTVPLGTVYERRVEQNPPIRVREVRPDVPEAFERVLAQALQLEPRRRWRSARAFRDALVDAAAEQSIRRGETLMVELVQRFAPRGGVDARLEEMPTRVRPAPAPRPSRPAPAPPLPREERPRPAAPSLKGLAAPPAYGGAEAEPSEPTPFSPQAATPSPSSNPNVAPLRAAPTRRRRAGLLGVAAVAVVATYMLLRPDASEEAESLPSPRSPVPEVATGKLVNLLKEARPEYALGFEERHRILDELRGREAAMHEVDLGNQALLDLFQIEQASAPCQALMAALDQFAQSPQRRQLAAIVHAEAWIDGPEGRACRVLKPRLQAAVRQAAASD